MAYYVRTKVVLKLGSNQGYNVMMAKLAPVMAQHGWTLILALQPLIGDFTEMLHVWEVAEFDDIRGALAACAGDPEVTAILAPMPELLQTEILDVMVKAPYSP